MMKDKKGKPYPCICVPCPVCHPSEATCKCGQGGHSKFCDPTRAPDVVGATIVMLRAMTKEEMTAEGWTENWHGCAPTVIVLSTGAILYPSRDEEGNGPGALFGSDPKTGKSYGFSEGGEG